MNKENERIALVTGATDGIGKEVARQLCLQDIKVVIGARNVEKGRGVAAEFRRDGLEIDIVQLDVTVQETVQRAAEELESRYGRLDILVNNAGIALDRGPWSTAPFEDVIATYETNLFGMIRVTQAFLPLLRRSAHGRIVNVSSSLASFAGMTDEKSPYYNVLLPVYASSKAAINVLTVHLARELEGTGIKVNAVEPGLTATRAVKIPGAQPVEVGAEAPVHYALIDDDGPTGQFFDRFGTYKW
ncbi:MAG: SDR family oxidoreductase [Verrucomicrobiota bacterium JB022]|nr:SDR family oxidoreductase [Verrucomicrobiota bacterium JB022]